MYDLLLRSQLPNRPAKSARFSRLIIYGMLALLCLTSCNGNRVSVQQSLIAQSWQSSVYMGSEEHCFLSKPTSQENSWAYFHSGDLPDANGYQWLLLQLAQPVRLVSVTIFARPGEEVSRRVVGTEVLLSAALPDDLLQPRTGSRCLASLRSMAAADAAFTNQCGRFAGQSEVDSLKLEFACFNNDCAKETRFILIRRLVSDQSDKMFNFVGMELEEVRPAEFLTCSLAGRMPHSCLRNGLQVLRSGREQEVVKACLPCRPMGLDRAPSCRLSSDADRTLRTRINNKTQPEFLIIVPVCPQCELKCNYRCAGQPDTISELSETLRTQVKPRAVKLQFGENNWAGHQQQLRQQFWPADTVVIFDFFTESGLPRPEHSCTLTGNQCALGGTVLMPEQESVQTDNRAGSSLTYSLSSRYRLFANASIERCVLVCLTQQRGTDWSLIRREKFPRLVYKCKTKFDLPARRLWVEGATLDIYVDSSENNIVPTSHKCRLRTSRSGTFSLSAVESQLDRQRSKFRLTLSRQWGHSVSMACQVNQSGLLTAEDTQLLPNVMHKADAQISSCYADQDSIKITVVTTGGEPTPKSVLCAIGKDSKSQTLVNASSMRLKSISLLTWDFEPTHAQLRTTSRIIFCTVTQTGQSDEVKFQTVFNASFETAPACEGGVNLWKVGIIVIAAVSIGPFLIAWACSLARLSRKALFARRHGSWTPSQICMATYERQGCSVDGDDGFSEWGQLGRGGQASGSNLAASTCNTLVRPGGSASQMLCGGELQYRQEPQQSVYNKVLFVEQHKNEVSKSGTSLNTEYLDIAGCSSAAAGSALQNSNA